MPEGNNKALLWLVGVMGTIIIALVSTIYVSMVSNDEKAELDRKEIRLEIKENNDKIGEVKIDVAVISSQIESLIDRGDE